MAAISCFLVLALSILQQIVLGVPQEALQSITATPTFLQSAAPELGGSSSAGSSSCGGCYLIADVAGLVWYSEVFINTAATALVSVGVGNGTSATRTSLLQNEGAFTFNPTDTASPGALTQLNFQPTINVQGAVLSSPTAYNVFTAYSITSAHEVNGVCVTVSGPKTILPTAYSEALTSADGRVTLDANGQRSFIDYLGFSSCSGGGENVAPTALVQVTNTTATKTSTYSNVPLAAALATLTIAPQSTVPAPASPGQTTGAPSTTIFPSVSAPQIVIGNSTITPTAHPVALSLFNGTFTAESTEILASNSVLPTGGNVSGPVTYFGGANAHKTDTWLVSGWMTVMLGLGAFVYYL